MRSTQNEKTMEIKRIRREERKRIGEGLHSGAAQTLSHALLLLNLHEQKGKKEDAEGVRQAIKMAINEIRHSISELRDEEPWPLIPSIRDCLSEFKDRWKIPIRFRTEGKDSAIPPKIRHYILTLIQEGLHNIAKHAGANACEIALKISRSQITVSVKDNGIGFNQAAIEKGAPHFGLKFMKERAEQMGGELLIVSANGRGTALKAVIPYKSRL